MNQQVLLKEGIRKQLAIEFCYDGHKRVVYPHHIGQLGKLLQLHAYQIAGGSVSNKIPCWKNFKIDKIADVKMLAEHFSRLSTYNPANSNYVRIDIQIS
jgi:hypothetical protein